MIPAFEFDEDKEYFDALFEEFGGLENNSNYFDFRDPGLKRKEFNKIAKIVREELIAKYGSKCQLQLVNGCTNTPDHVDHLIPLSSNELNKKLRNIGTSKINSKLKKVPSQSFGSNNPVNFVLACASCNQHKKHRLPDKSLLSRVFAQRSEHDH